MLAVIVAAAKEVMPLMSFMIVKKINWYGEGGKVEG